MPNYSQRVEAWNMQSDLDTHIQEDGKYYVLPGMHEVKRFEYSFAARMDLLEKYDIDAPRTIDEFYDMLVTLKQECAGVAGCYPMTDLYNNAPVELPAGNLLRTIGAAHGVRSGWDYDTVHWNFDTQQYEVTGTSDGYRETLEFLNKLVSEGLLDPETFTQTDDQARQKLAQGKAFVVSSNMQGLVNNYRNDVAAISGAEMGLLPIPTGPFGDRLFGGRLENGLILNAKVRESENFVALMQFIDWLFYSENGQEFAKWGQEGVTYTKNGDEYVLNENIRMLGFNPDAPEQLQIDYGVFNGAFVYGGTAELMNSFYTDEEAAFYAANVEGREILPLPPPAPVSEDEAVELGLIRAPLLQHVMTQSLQFILGNRPLSEWDTFVEECEGLQAGDYLEIVQGAQARFAETRG
jgi:putative aldouronate transport system substrate-binding protein